MDYLPLRSIIVCGKGKTMTRRHRLSDVQWARRHFIWRCVDWNSGKTRFALSNAGGKTHKQALLGLLCAGKGSIWWGGGGAVSWFGVEKWLTRRRALLSCKTISMHYINDVLCPQAIQFLQIEVVFGKNKNKTKKAIECNVFLC